MIDLDLELKKNSKSYYVYVLGVGNTNLSEEPFIQSADFVVGYGNKLVVIDLIYSKFVYTRNLSLEGKIVTLHGCTYFTTLYHTIGQYDYTIKLDEL